MKTRLIALAASLAFGTTIAARHAEAQQPAGVPATATGQMELSAADRTVPKLDAGPSESSVRDSRMTTAELRQARALYRAQQRVARLEYNLWMGYEPLRPNWNALPMMSSRYAPRRVYIPVYVRTR